MLQLAGVILEVARIKTRKLKHAPLTTSRQAAPESRR
jgi:hypothetical protein